MTPDEDHNVHYVLHGSRGAHFSIGLTCTVEKNHLSPQLSWLVFAFLSNPPSHSEVSGSSNPQGPYRGQAQISKCIGSSGSGGGGQGGMPPPGL